MFCQNNLIEILLCSSYVICHVISKTWNHGHPPYSGYELLDKKTWNHEHYWICVVSIYSQNTVVLIFVQQYRNLEPPLGTMDTGVRGSKNNIHYHHHTGKCLSDRYIPTFCFINGRVRCRFIKKLISFCCYVKIL